MRLQVVETDHRFSYRLFLRLVGAGRPVDAPDVMKVLCHRPEVFGHPFIRLVDALLRGPSDWSVGERELIATFTSKLNQCPFCTSSHDAVASLELGSELVAAVMADYRSAPISKGLKATLGLVERLTHAPKTLTRADIEAVREIGVSERAILQALYICAAFNTINRVADALNFDPLVGERLQRGSEALLRRGYRIPPPAPWRRVRHRRR